MPIRHLLLTALPSALVSAAVSLAMVSMFGAPAAGEATVVVPEAAAQRSPAGVAGKAQLAAVEARETVREAAAPSVAPSTNEDIPLKARLAEMSEELSMLRVEQRRQVTLVQSLLEERERQEAFVADYEPDLVELQELDARNEARSREQLAEREADTAYAFEVEDVDAAWTAKLAQRLEATHDDDVFLESHECRQSLCRLVVEYDDALVRLEFENRLPLLVRGITSDMTVAGDTDEQADGAMRSVYYLERPR